MWTMWMQIMEVPSWDLASGTPRVGLKKSLKFYSLRNGAYKYACCKSKWHCLPLGMGYLFLSPVWSLPDKDHFTMVYPLQVPYFNHASQPSFFAWAFPLFPNTSSLRITKFSECSHQRSFMTLARSHRIQYITEDTASLERFNSSICCSEGLQKST